jgi:hypothetical protein
VFYIYMERLQDWLAARRKVSAEPLPQRVEHAGDMAVQLTAAQRRH